jgi:hypothetical protein
MSVKTKLIEQRTHLTLQRGAAKDQIEALEKQIVATSYAIQVLEEDENERSKPDPEQEVVQE